LFDDAVTTLAAIPSANNDEQRECLQCQALWLFMTASKSAQHVKTRSLCAIGVVLCATSRDGRLLSPELNRQRLVVFVGLALDYYIITWGSWHRQHDYWGRRVKDDFDQSICVLIQFGYINQAFVDMHLAAGNKVK
jgi:hypothetical protein